MYTALALTPATDRYVETAFTLAPHQVVILEDAKADELLNDFPDWFDVVDMDCDAVLLEGTVFVGAPFAYPVETAEPAPITPEVSPAAEEGETKGDSREALFGIDEPALPGTPDLLNTLLDNASNEAADTDIAPDQDPAE